MTKAITQNQLSQKQLAQQYFAEARGWDADISLRIKKSEIAKNYYPSIIVTLIKVDLHMKNFTPHTFWIHLIGDKESYGDVQYWYENNG